FQAEDGIRGFHVTGVQTCALPIYGDFAEGIRALLIDKDRNPSWNPATLAEADRAWADTFFASPWADAAHPLADLGTPVAERSLRSEERRVGKEGGARWRTCQDKTK